MTILRTSVPPVRPRFAVPRYASWQDALKDAVRDADQLCRLLELPPGAAGAAEAAAKRLGLLVPRGYVARMRPGDPADPLLRQVLPLGEESADVAGFVADPVGDLAATRQPGLLQKYAGRVLLLATGACAVHCCYCFRRHYPYDDAPRSLADWRPALDEIAADRSVREVILSGGDPLMLVDGVLAGLVDELAAIGHLRRLRIHTRLPIVIPERVTDELLMTLRGLSRVAGVERSEPPGRRAGGALRFTPATQFGTRLVPIVVVHANHANELDDNVARALARLADAGVPLLNQAVLLRGVNDSVDAQASLCERLVDLRVMPYYLHQLDRVAGAAHFEVPIEVGRRIVTELRSRLPGYAVPRYVREVPGAASKTNIG
jgi:L-lysine 2,3-aminomutase